MLMTHRIKRTLALCVVTAWASLSCIHLADALEDAKEGPEPVDVLVAQALATPVEQSVSLSGEGFSASILPNRLVVSTPAVLGVHALPTVYASPDLQVIDGPPPRAKPSLFQLFSVYRL